MDISKYEEDIQKAINNFIQDAQKLQEKIKNMENLKQVTKKTLEEIQEKLSNIRQN